MKLNRRQAILSAVAVAAGASVTGCNSGLGYETMRVLALRGAHVPVQHLLPLML